MGGLCRYCGRLNERAAEYDRALQSDLLDLDRDSGGAITDPKPATLSSTYCREHKPPVTGQKNAAYQKALRHQEEYDDVRARLQRQSHHNQCLKTLHSKHAVNWFENQVVRRIQASSLIDSDPRRAAESAASWEIVDLKGPCLAFTFEEISKALPGLYDKITNPAGHFQRSETVNLIWSRLLEKGFSDAYWHVRVLILYSQGMNVLKIADRQLCEPQSVRDVLRSIVPVIPATFDEVILSRAARDLVDKKIDDFKKEIIYLMTIQKMKQAQVADALNVSRQLVSRALGSIPMAYRFDRKVRVIRIFRNPFVDPRNRGTDGTEWMTLGHYWDMK